MNLRALLVLPFVLAGWPPVWAEQAPPAAAGRRFGDAAATVQRQLKESIAELDTLRQQMAADKVPLSKRLSDLERELTKARQDYQQTTRLLDSRTLDLTTLKSEVKSRQEEAGYLSNLLGEYNRNFESRLHIAEVQRYRQPLEAAKLAPENSNLSQEQVYAAQVAMVTASLARLQDALGGTRFDGTAVDAGGLVRSGTFMIVGPVALFRSADGAHVGTVEQRLGSLEPSVVPFGDGADAEAAAAVVASADGPFPFDPTLGHAHKIEATQETLGEHIHAGGPVMYPILALAGAALLVAIGKALAFGTLRQPSPKRVKALLQAVAERDDAALKKTLAGVQKAELHVGRTALGGAAVGAAVGTVFALVHHFFPSLWSPLGPAMERWPALAGLGTGLVYTLAVLGSAVLFTVLGALWGVLKGGLQWLVGRCPVGRMLAVGVEHIREPHELIEEVMYETVLATRLKLQRFLPFIALSASSAPLLGLLGTVTGIISTFKLITVYGSGDVKTLSSGISEALITTEYGLYVAIPSLLMYAFLARKARGLIDQMEKAGLAFVNQVSKASSDVVRATTDKEELEDAPSLMSKP
jgi:hypothetical protein